MLSDFKSLKAKSGTRKPTDKIIVEHGSSLSIKRCKNSSMSRNQNSNPISIIIKVFIKIYVDITEGIRNLSQLKLTVEQKDNNSSLNPSKLTNRKTSMILI